MKKFILFVTLTLITFAGFSQTKGISYQAVIIDPNPIELPGQDIVSQPYVSKDVWIKFGIYSGSTLQYEELQKTKTDEYGLVNLIIGSGINTGQAGTFTSLSWDGPTKNIVTSVSFDQGARYTQVSNQRLNYVPYSYFAESAGKLSGVLSINQGGTGATNAAAARANLGLGNVDNTADAEKPVSLATLAILDVKESLANKSQNIIADSASIVKYPSVKAIKDYIDNRTSLNASQANNANLAAKATALETARTINGVPFDGTANITIPVGVTPPDADATTKGLVQLAGDLSGTAASPSIADGAVGTVKLADASVTNAKIVSVAGSKVTGDIAGNAATATLAATATSAEKATKLTTSRTINGVAFDGTADITIPVGVTPVDADATTKGILQLAGDLSGTAASPSIAAGAVGTAKLADGSVTSGKLADASVTNAKIVSVAGSKVTGDIAGNAATATLAADATKLATPRNINGIPFDGTADITISASSSTLSGTISIANGGTGATTAAGARTNLGLAIGTDVQAPLSFTAPLVQNGNGVSISQATPSVAGFLSSVDYTSFSNKIDATEKGANNGVATLGNNGKIPSVQIPAISFQNVNVVNSDASMIAISGAQVGSIAIRTDNNQNFVLSALPASTLSNWIALATPLYVSSVNGYAGPNISLTTNDVGEGSTNKYFTDARARNSISAISPLNYNATTGVISMTTASTNSSGFLTASDFTTFNNKQTALTAGVDYLSPTGSAASLTNFPTLNQNTTGNAATATKFATSRTINGVAFDGSTNITVAADANTLTGTSLASNVVNSSLTTLGTITSGVWSGTTIDIAKGGTGAITAAAARTNLGLAIGTDVLAPNASITAATKTKITYDTKGLVTAGTDATTADIAPSTNRNYVTDAQAGVLLNTSGVNTGDQTITLTGDVSGTGTGSFATTVNSVGGVGSSTISGFDTRITSNTSSITALNTNVAANTASITSNTADIALKASIASPNLTGTPTAPTATAGTNTTQLATTAFVNTAVSNYTPTTSLGLAGGLAGNIPYQTAPGTTGFIPNGAANQFLTSTGSGTYTWTSASNVTGNFVPYTGATGAVNLGAYDLTVNGLKVGLGNSAEATNTAIGAGVLAFNNNSSGWGTAQTAIGYYALYNNTTGYSNTAVGYNSLKSNTTGGVNTGLGYQTLYNNTSGGVNLAAGGGALFKNTTGSSNTALGFNSIYYNTTGANNVGVGANALYNLASGDNNLALGYNAAKLAGSGTGVNLTNSNKGIYIGTDVRAGTNTSTNEVVIGYGAIGNGSNTVTVGNLSNTATYFTGDINLTGKVSGGTWSGTVIGSNYGGAGLVNGILKANGSGVVSAAVAGTDYMAANAITTLTGDVDGSGNGSFATTVNSVGGVSSSTISGFDARITNSANNIASNTSSITSLTSSVNANTASITQNIADINLKASIASPNLTGTPTAPTATAGTNTTQLATTAFVNTAVSNYTPTTSLSLAGGLAGNIPYQTAPGTTGFIPNGAANQFLTATGSGTYTWTSASNVTGNFVPYTGATGAVNLGAYDLTVNALTVGKGAGGNSLNTGMGYQVMQSNTTGYSNIAMGYQVMKSNTTGYSNTAIGYQGMLSNTTGYSNTTIGYQGLQNNTIGAYNTAVGYMSLNANTTSHNTGLGNKSLQYLNSGTGNVAIGSAAGMSYGTNSNLTTSDKSIFIGNGTMAKSNSSNNEVVIGYGATGNGSNTVTVGNLSNTATYFTGDINLTGNVNGGTWSGTVIGSNYGGAGSVNGLLKANGSGVVSAAVSGTDYLTPNAPITAATKTKISYDANGLVTSSADATTADIAPSTNRNYVTDVQAGIISNTSGVNTGDQTITLTGDVTGTGTGTFTSTLAYTGVTANTYGSSTHVPILTVDAKGRITSASTTAINGGVNTMTTIAATSNANGATISGTELTLTPADANNGGIVTNGTQTIGGAKTFVNAMTVSPTATSSSNGANTVISAQSATSSTNTGGGLILNSGSGGSSANAGNINLNAGSAGFYGGSISLNAGAGGTNGGNITLTPGSGTTSGIVQINGQIKITGGSPSNGKVLTSDAAGLATWVAPTGITSVGAISASATANGASITSGVLNLTPANATNGGVVTTGPQTFAGTKTFNSDLKINSITAGQGNNALQNNTAFGVLSLSQASSTGNSNTAFGYYTLRANTNGVNNTAIGDKALSFNTTGSDNVAIGNFSLYSKTIYNRNIAIGNYALYDVTGDDNIAIGNQAGINLGSAGTAGTALKNILIGSYSGGKVGASTTMNTTGRNSVLIGYDVRPAADDETNEIVIAGYNGTAGAVGLGSNTTLIGNSATTNTRIMGELDLPSTTSSTSTTSGALKVSGGAGIAGALNVGGTTTLTGATTISNTTASTSTNTGALIVRGGVGVAGNVTIGGTLEIDGGSPGAGKVLTSDANGLASWSNAAGSTVVTTNTSYAITLTEAYVFYTGAGSGAFTIPAAAAGNAGKEITIKNKTAFGITVTPDTGTVFIDSANAGAASVAIGIEASNNWIKLVSDGTQWNVIRALF